MLQMFLAIPILLMSALTANSASDLLDPNATYQLISVDAVPYLGTANISLPVAGTILGKGPCNTFAGEQSATYPEFRLGAIRATRRGCPELELENLFFEALQSMQSIEISGATLILSNKAGRELVFQAVPR